MPTDVSNGNIRTREHAEEDANGQVTTSGSQATYLGLASLICALVFPLSFWGIGFMEKYGISIPAPPGGKTTFALFLTGTSLAALVFGVSSLLSGVRKTALIGLIVGIVELFMCLMFFPH